MIGPTSAGPVSDHRVSGGVINSLVLLAVVGAYRLKGMGDLPRDILFPILGLIVGTSLMVALQCRWEYLSLLGAAFVLGALPGHDKYFSAIDGIESSHKGIPWIDFIVDSIVPLRSLDISQSLNKKGHEG